MTTTAVIADAQPLHRDGLRLLLESNNDIKVAGVATTEDELLREVQSHHPELVVMGCSASCAWSLSSICAIRKDFPHCKMVIISSDHDDEHIHSVLDAGVHAYLTKECSKEQMSRGLEAAIKGERFFCSKVLDILIQKKARPQSSTIEHLTARENEVAGWVGKGKKPFEIADELSLSIHTVRTHIKNIMRKLDKNTISDLALYVVKQGELLP